MSNENSRWAKMQLCPCISQGYWAKMLMPSRFKISFITLLFVISETEKGCQKTRTVITKLF